MPERATFDHMLRGIDRHLALDDLRQSLKPFYSQIGRPSVDPELMIRMLIVGYCMGIRSERRLCDEVHLNLAYRWFCRLGLDGKVPDHSTFSIVAEITYLTWTADNLLRQGGQTGGPGAARSRTGLIGGSGQGSINQQTGVDVNRSLILGDGSRSPSQYRRLGCRSFLRQPRLA